MKGNKIKKVLERTILLPHLPEEIIFEIISKIPLGYRFKFRCVCKSWSIRFNNPKQLVLIGGNNDVYTLDNDSLASPLLDDFAVRSNKLESSLASTALLTAKSSFVGSCNGIICVSPPNNFCCLWNPFTNEYRLLPSQPSEFFRDSPIDLYGFGYDSKSDDYKLVLVGANSINFKPSEGIVYSLRSNAWKQMQSIPYKFYRSQKYGVFCNGALHWFASPSKLLSLDMTDEITREIPEPDANFCNNACIRISVLDGCLCLLLSNSIGFEGFEVWVMKDYGNKDSWTKTYFIPKLKLPKKLTRIEYLTRIECLKTGELLLEGCFWAYQKIIGHTFCLGSAHNL